MLPQVITEYTLVFGGSLSLLFSAIHLYIRGRQVENYNLSFLLFTVGILQFQFLFVISGYAFSCPEILFLHLTVLFMAIALAYRAYFFVVFPSREMSGRRWLIFVPALAVLPLDVVFMFLGREGRVNIITSLFHGGETRQNLSVRIVIALAGVEIFLLLGGLLVRMVREYRVNKTSIIPVNIIYVFITMLASETILYGYLSVTLAAVKAGAVIISILFASSYLIGVRYPSLIQLAILEVKRQYGRKKLLNGIDAESLLYNLERLMNEEKLYSSETLTLKELADILSITPHQLSHLLNSELDTNFNAFINQYRVDEAKRLLLHEPARSIISIAYDVGFNSKSTFYDAFARFAGTTPKHFRETGC